MYKELQESHMYLLKNYNLHHKNKEYYLATFSETKYNTVELIVSGKTAKGTDRKYIDYYGTKHDIVKAKYPIYLNEVNLNFEDVIDFEDSEICYLLLNLDNEIYFFVEMTANELENEFKKYNHLSEIENKKFKIAYSIEKKEIQIKLAENIEISNADFDLENDFIKYGVLKEGTIYKIRNEHFVMYLGEIYAPINFKLNITGNETRKIKKAGINLFLPLYNMTKEEIYSLTEFENQRDFIKYYSNNIIDFLKEVDINNYYDLIESQGKEYADSVYLYKNMSEKIQEENLIYVKKVIKNHNLKSLNIQDLLYKKLEKKSFSNIKKTYTRMYKNKARFNLKDVEEFINFLNTTGTLLGCLNLYENSFISTKDTKDIQVSSKNFKLYLMNLLNNSKK